MLETRQTPRWRAKKPSVRSRAGDAAAGLQAGVPSRLKPCPASRI